MARGRTLTEFQASFPDEARCAAFLFKQRPRRASCALIAAAGARFRIRIICKTSE